MKSPQRDSGISFLNIFRDDFLSAIGGYDSIINLELRRAIQAIVEDELCALDDENSYKVRSISYRSGAPNNLIKMKEIIKHLEDDSSQPINLALSGIQFMCVREKTYNWISSKHEMYTEWANGNRTISKWVATQMDYEMFGCWFIDSADQLQKTLSEYTCRFDSLPLYDDQALPNSLHKPIVPLSEGNIHEAINTLEVLGELFYKLTRRLPENNLKHSISNYYCELCSGFTSTHKRFCNIHMKPSSDRTRREGKLRNLASKLIGKSHPLHYLLTSKQHHAVHAIRNEVWKILEIKWLRLMRGKELFSSWKEHDEIRNLVDQIEMHGGIVNREIAASLRREGLTYGEIGEFFGCSRQAVHYCLNHAK